MKIARNPINDMFIAAVLNTKQQPTILVKFDSHTDYDPFPAASLPLLKTDPGIDHILDGDTGEVIYHRGE